MVVSLYLHSLSHGQLYVAFSSRIERGMHDPFYFIGLNKGLKFCYGNLPIATCMDNCSYVAFSRVECTLDDPENLGHLDHFMMGK